MNEMTRDMLNDEAPMTNDEGITIVRIPSSAEEQQLVRFTDCGFDIRISFELRHSCFGILQRNRVFPIA